MSLEDIKLETVYQYRNRHKSYRPDYIWNSLFYEEYLQMIGTAQLIKIEM